MNRYKITIEYDGTPFHGWQRQENLDTVQQCLEEAVLPLTKSMTTMHGAGRTDSGVHAFEQVAHFSTEYELDCFRVQECMNARMCEIPISILSVEKVSNDFHARFSAVERAYLYKILNRKAKPSIDINRAWHVTPQLDEEKMNAAAQYLVGNHDFSSFRASGCQSNSAVKTINKISVNRIGDIVTIEVSAKSFLYHQVRNIVGSLVLVGHGKWSIQHFIDVFDSKDRKKAGAAAPACGLYFLCAIY